MSTPDNRTVPSWPSLYDPGIEILHIMHRAPVQPGGAYLYHSPGTHVFRFTLYWTLIFYTPIFLVCGTYAFLNLTFPPSPLPPPPISPLPLSPLFSPASARSQSHPLIPRPRTKGPKPNERRSRVAFALLVLLAFLVLSVAGAVAGSAVLGFVVAGLYQAARFNMSTCVYASFMFGVFYCVLGVYGA
ncbi:hypothetical protein BD779DRAFT_1446457 [Infundibulicybe gibba]|nr:hypothetical protein BD779DRAFT_1446457 [Infundibulicybe gibba]